MKRYSLACLAFILTGCAGNTDQCGMAGTWLEVSNLGDEIKYMEGDRIKGLEIRRGENDRIDFAPDGIITGGRDDGYQTESMVATRWECEGIDRVILSRSGPKEMTGLLSDRKRIYGSGVLVNKGMMGVRFYTVKMAENDEATYDRLLTGIEEYAMAHDRPFGRLPRGAR